jgi:predicted RNA methylase
MSRETLVKKFQKAGYISPEQEKTTVQKNTGAATSSGGRTALAERFKRAGYIKNVSSAAAPSGRVPSALGRANVTTPLYMSRVSAPASQTPSAMDRLRQAAADMFADTPRSAEQEGTFDVSPTAYRKSAAQASAEVNSNRESMQNAAGYLGKNTLAGLAAFDSQLTGTGQFFLGRPLQAAGWKNNPISLLNEKYKKNEEETKAAASDVNAKVGEKAGWIGDNLIQSTFSTLPQALLAIMSGGTSAVAGTASEVASAASSAQKATSLTGTIGSAMNTLVKDPNYWLSFVQTAGSDYERAKADGVNDAAAGAYAVLNSLLNANIEVGGGIQKLPGQLKENEGNALLKWIKSSVEEGNEEVVQQAVSQAMENVVGGTNNPLVSISDENAVINPKVLGQNWALGTAIGGILGGGQSAAQYGLSRAARNNVSQGTAQNAQVVENPQAQQQSAAEIQPKTQEPAAKPTYFSGIMQNPTDEENGELNRQKLLAALMQTNSEQMDNRAREQAKNLAQETSSYAPIMNIAKAQEKTPEAVPAPAINTDAASLAPVAKTLGESGAKALASFYDGQTDTGAYSEEFVKTYNAGKNGESKPAAGVLTEGQSTAAFFAGKNDAKANAPLQNQAAGNTITGEKKFIRAKKSEWNSTDSEWYVPGHKQAIAYSTTSTRDSIGVMADDNPTATISELRDMFIYDNEAKKVLSAYIDNGYGGQVAGEWFSYNKKQGPESKSALTDIEEWAVKSYKSGDSYKINSLLLTKSELNDYYVKLRDNLDSALEKLPIYTGKVYRNLSFDDFGGKEDMDAFVAKHEIGLPVLYGAYTSSSKSTEGHPINGEYVVNLEIESITGREMSGYGNNSEQEILFSRNALFIPTEITIGRDGHPLIRMQEVIDNGAIQQGTNGRYSERTGKVEQGKTAEGLQGKMRNVPAVSEGKEPYNQEAEVRKIPGGNSDENPNGSGSLPEISSEHGEVKGPAALADKISSMLARGKQFNSAWLFEQADKAFGGTMAAGAYTVKDAYDAMELAVNKTLMTSEKVKAANGDAQTARKMTASLENMLRLLPTQTKRSAEMEQFQQFSTPPNIAYIAAWCADINDGDVVLEPSAGIGGLALWPKAWGATVYGNELSKRRLELLNQLGLDGTFNFNAEQIDNMLPESIKPTAIIMNPPFSATAGRMSSNSTKNAEAHIEQALYRLEDGGRLVAILGRGMADDASAFKSWWAGIKKEYNVRANIQIDGSNYKKYGTSFDIQLVVIDKNGPTTGKTLTGKYTELDKIPALMEGIRNDRTAIQENAGNGKQSGADSRHLPAGNVGGPAVGAGRSTIGNDKPGLGASVQIPDGERGSKRIGVQGRDTESVSDVGKSGSVGEGPEQQSGNISGSGSVDVRHGGLPAETVLVKSEVSLEDTQKETAEAVEADPDNVYSAYVPKKVHIKGAKKHPAKLVESAAMAAVDPPDVTYTPNLPQNIIDRGYPSTAQLENIVYAGQAHSQILPNGTRKGYFIGDGTGVGKGIQIAGIMLDNFRQGRTKAVWISEKSNLIKDARRDWKDIGGKETDVLPLNKFKYGSEINLDSGILFASYDTIKEAQQKGGADTRLAQLQRWLGKDFDGVIAFDEAHNMGNSVGQKKKRGKTKPSLKALKGIELQEAFPNARIVYASATGATEVSNYAYLERLGLWGKGTAFHDVNDFIAKISSGGLTAMELVARDMKAMGVYMARGISYDDVKYDTLQHDLTPMQTEIYNTMSRAWQKVFQNIGKALETTKADKNGDARRSALGAFYNSQQSFYNQVLTSMSMPSVIVDIKKELAAGHSAVIQLVNTNEAAAKRAIAKAEDEGTDFEDLDMTPTELLVGYLENSFPVQAFELYTDDKGNKLSRPVLDADGNPVLDRRAVAQRDALIAEVKQMKVPDGPLELLFDAFGEEQIAERTGRTRRLVEKPDENGVMRRVVEKRSASSGLADAQMFQDGKKRILVFSEAGGTGASYHADLRAKNQQQRIHYLLQPGWNAAKAVQGFGRTHRSNEASAPVYKLITTNIMGQKRFTSTIARRLDQLGALTKGQRQTGSGMFGEKDNLENPISQDALQRYYKTISPDVLKKLGLYENFYDQFGVYKDDVAVSRDVGRFLNRILSLEVDEQNEVFNGFYDTFERMLDAAIANGSVDMGLENYVADKVEVQDEKVIRKDASGADTKYVQMTAYRKSDLIAYSSLKKIRDNFTGLYRMEDGSVRAAYEIASKTGADGSIERRFRLQAPQRSKSSVYLLSTMEEKTTAVDKADWKTAWEDETAKAPEFEETKLHMLTGTLLPIWDKLPTSNTRVMRVLADGKQYLGRIIKPSDIDGVLKTFGAQRTQEVYTPKQIKDKVMNDGATVVLRDDKVRITRRRVSGEYRMEITGSNAWYLARTYSGIITERINYDTRYFIPTSELGMNILADIIKDNPVIEMNSAGGSDELIVLNKSSQSVGSAKTSINGNKLPAIFTKVKTWGPGTVNLDLGGGRYDNATEYLKSLGVTSYVLDKYNRSAEENALAAEKTQEGQSDTVTISNVLNVIKEQSGRDEVLANAVDAVKPNGTVYITVYEGNGKGVGKYSQFDKETGEATSWQENRLTSQYITEIRKFFSDVSIKNKVIVARGPKKAKSVSLSDTVDRFTAVAAPEKWTAKRVGSTNKTPMSLSEIISKIEHDVGINITNGHIRGGQTLGEYNRNSQGVRSRIAHDLPTIAHELGHHFDNVYGLSDGLGRGEIDELTGNLSDEMRSAYPGKKLPREGIAEFLRRYLQNSETAAIDYPKFSVYFHNALSAKDNALIEQLADEANAYYSMDAGTAASAIVNYEDSEKSFDTFGEKLRAKSDDMYQAWIDGLHGIKRFDRAAGTNTYIYASNAAYSDAAAGSILTGSLTDANGQYVSAGLTTALSGINLKSRKEYRDFGEYLVVKHGPERLKEGMRIFADDRKNSSSFMEARQAELEEQYPNFKAASERLYEFQTDFLKAWGIDTGLVSKESADKWAERWEYYVPLNRAVGDKRAGTKQGFANQNSTIKRAHGSGLDIINPVDNIINNVVRMVNAGTRNNVMQQITDAAENESGLADFLEKVPMPIKVEKFRTGKLKNDLTKAVDESMLSGAMHANDASAAYDIIDNIDDILLQYGRGKAFGDVVTVMRSGKPEYWKINDAMLLDSVTSMSESRLPAWLQAYGSVSRFMTSNITGNNILWSIFSNWPRDVMTMFTYSKDKNPVHIMGGIASAYANRVKGMHADPLYKEYLAMGGGKVSVYSAERNLAKGIRKRISGDNARWLNPMEWLSFVSDTIETGPRYAYYKMLREKGYTSQEAFYESTDITTNFRRHGSNSRQINQIVPFFNAGVQGLDKFARWITAEEAPAGQRAKAIRTRVTVYAAISAVLAGLIYALNNRDDEARKNYAQLSNYTKNSYWCIPTGGGKYFCIPKPREIAVLSSFMEASAEKTAGNNAHALDGFYEYATDTALPSGASELAQGDLYGLTGNFGVLGVIVEMRANRDFMGKPIVSSGMSNLEPKDQYTQRTSKIAKALGDAFDQSPMLIDYFFNNTLGGWWKAQKALFPVGSENVDYTLGIQSTYIKDNQYSNDIVNWLYDKAAETSRHSKSNPDDTASAIAAKMDSNMTSFYSAYNKLSKNVADTAAHRATRQTVLDMIAEYRKADDAGSKTDVQTAIEKVCETTGSTEYLPAVMDSAVKDAAGETHLLSDVQYVEYQTEYNSNYYGYVEGTLSSAGSTTKKAAVLAAAKQRAKLDATNAVLRRIGASAEADKYSGIKSSDTVNFLAGLDVANDDGSITQAEVIAVLRSMNISNNERSELFGTRYKSDKHNPWA